MKKVVISLLVISLLTACDAGGKKVAAPSGKNYPMMTTRWTDISLPEDKKKIFINDSDGGIIGDEQKRFWLKELEKEKGFYTLFHYQVDCIGNKFRNLAFFKYNDKKDVFSSWAMEEDDVKWLYIPPESRMNAYRDAICSGWRPAKNIEEISK